MSYNKQVINSLAPASAGNTPEAVAINLLARSKAMPILSPSIPSPKLGAQTKNLLGQAFGNWRVIAFAGYKSPSSSHSYWRCECKCGKQQDVRGTKLVTGKSFQCGDCNKIAARIGGKYSRSRLPSGEASFKTLFDNYQRNARKRGIPFALSVEQARILFQSSCRYCGATPSAIQRARHLNSGSYSYNGIDRMDNQKGYVFDNCVPCCATCNFAKRDMSADEFIAWAGRVYRHCGGITSA